MPSDESQNLTEPIKDDSDDDVSDGDLSDRSEMSDDDLSYDERVDILKDQMSQNANGITLQEIQLEQKYDELLTLEDDDVESDYSEDDESDQEDIDYALMNLSKTYEGQFRTADITQSADFASIDPQVIDDVLSLRQLAET